MLSARSAERRRASLRGGEARKIDLSDIAIPENAYDEVQQILQDLFTPLNLSVMLGNPGAAVASDLIDHRAERRS